VRRITSEAAAGCQQPGLLQPSHFPCRAARATNGSDGCPCLRRSLISTTPRAVRPAAPIQRLAEQLPAAAAGAPGEGSRRRFKLLAATGAGKDSAAATPAAKKRVEILSKLLQVESMAKEAGRRFQVGGRGGEGGDGGGRGGARGERRGGGSLRVPVRCGGAVRGRLRAVPLLVAVPGPDSASCRS
jgi:hypothetical protein